MKSLDFKLENLKKAYRKLCDVCDVYDGKDDIVRDSVIQRFEFTYELSHKTLQEFMRFMGVNMENKFPRNIFRTAYANNIIDDDKLWIKIMNDRNHTSHIYSEDMSDDIAFRIVNEYLPAFDKLITKIEHEM